MATQTKRPTQRYVGDSSPRDHPQCRQGFQGRNTYLKPYIPAQSKLSPSADVRMCDVMHSACRAEGVLFWWGPRSVSDILLFLASAGNRRDDERRGVYPGPLTPKRQMRCLAVNLRTKTVFPDLRMGQGGVISKGSRRPRCDTCMTVAQRKLLTSQLRFVFVQ